jgi:hypothetical protein
MFYMVSYSSINNYTVCIICISVKKYYHDKYGDTILISITK